MHVDNFVIVSLIVLCQGKDDLGVDKKNEKTKYDDSANNVEVDSICDIVTTNCM